MYYYEALFNHQELYGFVVLLQKLLYKDYYPYISESNEILAAKIQNKLRSYLESLGNDNFETEGIIESFYEQIPKLQSLVMSDLFAAYEADPAANSYKEIILAYPGPLAVLIQRTAHILYQLKTPILPRILTEYAHSLTGIDIHPGARIGKRFFIDHGTGVVIGETTIIGNDVKIYQGVTLGAISTSKGRKLKSINRHPIIEDGVIIYAGASVLGGDTVIGRNSIIGSNAFVTHSVRENSKINSNI